MLHSLAKLERLDITAHHISSHSRTALPPLSSSASAVAAHHADVYSSPVLSAHTSLLDRHSRSSSQSNNLIRPRSPSPHSLSPRSYHSGERDREEDDDEARLNAQYRLKQRLKERSRLEASRHKRQQLMSDKDRVDGEDEEEREARLTSLAHSTMPPSPILRTRSLRPSKLSSTDSELPPLSPRTPLGELSVLQKQKQRVGGSSEVDDGNFDGTDEDAVMTDEGATTTPCLRVAKRLQHPPAAQKLSLSLSDVLQSPHSYFSSPAVSSTLSTAASSPSGSIPSITRSVMAHFAGSPYSTTSPPYTSSSLPSPVPASPATLPLALLHSPAMDGGKQRAFESRPGAMFTRRNLT